MPEFTANRLTLRWDALDLVTDTLQKPAARVVVGARPAHPTNVVVVLYTVDGGAERVARGYRLGPAVRSDGEELFAIDLPPQPEGAALAFMPVLSCSGREADPRRGGFPFTPLVQAPAPPAAPAADFRQPAHEPFGYAMELLARVTAPLERRPVVIGETAEGLRIAFSLGEGGTVRGPRLNGAILHSGGDWMLIRRDGIGLSEARVLIRTDDGGIVLGEYGGIVDFGPGGHEALANDRGPEQAAVQLAPSYETAAASLLWLNRLQCIALGRVTMSTLLVEYDVYAMRSRAARTA
jgi:hypothetical protein